MAAAQRNGDSNDGGGVINSIPQSTVFVNSKLVSVNGSVGTGHPTGPTHSAGTWKTANGSSTVFAEKIAINRTGDADTCEHTRAGGSDDVFVG
tara:strand:- start:400 stop:678 length:279 start_codon:yes stop_codon:yes gene_type:complete